MIVFPCGIFTFPDQQYQRSRKAGVKVNTDGIVSVQGEELLFLFHFTVMLGLGFPNIQLLSSPEISEIICVEV